MKFSQISARGIGSIPRWVVSLFTVNRAHATTLKTHAILTPPLTSTADCTIGIASLEVNSFVPLVGQCQQKAISMN